MVKKNIHRSSGSPYNKKVVLGVMAIVVLLIAVFGVWKIVQKKSSIAGQATGDGDSDRDGDGTPDRYDDDIDGDGWANKGDKDIDGDGKPNDKDLTPYGPDSACYVGKGCKFVDGESK